MSGPGFDVDVKSLEAAHGMLIGLREHVNNHLLPAVAELDPVSARPCLRQPVGRRALVAVPLDEGLAPRVHPAAVPNLARAA